MDLPVAIALLSLIPLSLFLFLHRSNLKEPPTVPGAWPILGHLPLLARSQATHHLLGEIADKHGPLFTINLGAKKTLVISNWETAKECFTTNDVAASYRPHLVACEHMTYNLAMLGFAPYGQFWRDMRRNVASAFLSDHRIDSLSHVRVAEVRTSMKELFNKWTRAGLTQDGVLVVEMRQWLKELALNVVMRMVAGKRYFGESAVVNEREAQRCLKALREYMRLLGVFAVADAVPWLRWFDFGGHERAMEENFKELDGVVTEWLEEHRRERDLRGGKGGSDGDFMDVMLSMIDGTTIHGFDADTVIKATAMILR
ncbi:Cytochrome P450 82A3 [Spatholobus suberectus]|nr:Cytochrome P450 82A3 [Spatholobus suberectus]